MTRALSNPLLLLAVLAGCPSDPEPNAATVWLAPDGVETRVRLVPDRPPPF
jgi:hypothetical protein